MSTNIISPTVRARPWGLWTLAIIAVSNISVLTSLGIWEYLARTLIVGGFIAITVYLIAFGVFAFISKK